QGARIPNFNDDYMGAAPDVGAAEAGKPAMKFGVAAASSSSSAGGTGTTTAPPAAPPASSGGLPVSTSILSSAPSVAAGVNVGFTVHVMGNGATPTGTLTFMDNGAPIASCGSMLLGLGTARCLTNTLAAGVHSITAQYSGNSTYATGTAGPLTQTVTGKSGSTGSTTALALSIDSSAYTIAHGTKVTLTVRLSGGNTPGGTINFQDGLGSVAGCAAVPLANGVATCSASWSAAGSHSLRGLYSGDARNGAGIAGPLTEKVT
ncbi:MAG TPA: Ig-like domain-containing protein, partial [Usitatibacter sp.]|nr:Ig-like domain-containing protein [Usitatibacter sp.]